MSVKTTGAEFLTFYHDDTYWPQGAYVEDVELKVNGQLFDQDICAENLAKDAKVTIVGGGVYDTKPTSTQVISLVTFFKQWRKQSLEETFSVTCDKGLSEQVRTAILAAGGKIH